MPDKIVSGTVTLHVAPISTDKAISDVNRILTKSGYKSWVMKPKENSVVLKGKDINVDKIVSELKSVISNVQVSKIEEDPKPPPSKVYTTELKVESLCCEDKADKIKSKLKAIQGIAEVSVDLKLKKVTVKSTIESKLVVEAAAKIVAVQLWPEKEKEKKDDAKKAVVQHQPAKVFVVQCDWCG